MTNTTTSRTATGRSLGAFVAAGVIVGAPLAATGTATTAAAVPAMTATAAPATTAAAAPVTHDWSGVAHCESTGNWSADTGNGFYGGLQFTRQTWNAFGGSGNPAAASRAEQERVAENVLSVQGPGAWPVCGQYLTVTPGPAGTDHPAGNAGDADPIRTALEQSFVRNHDGTYSVRLGNAAEAARDAFKLDLLIAHRNDGGQDALPRLLV